MRQSRTFDLTGRNALPSHGNKKVVSQLSRLMPIVAACLLMTSAGLPEIAGAQAGCTFKLGFKALRDLIPDVVGNCLEDEHFNLSNGNAEQRTTGGLLVWRKADNWTAFTDGATTWILGPEGLADRPNAGPLFPWEGTIVLQDNFDDPANGLLPRSSPFPTRYTRGYVDGEYMIKTLDPEARGIPIVVVAEFANFSLAVDARLVGGSERRYVTMGCRDEAPLGTGHYRFSVETASGHFTLNRSDSGGLIALVDWQTSPAIRRGNEWNRLELTCAGTTIAASVNGTQVASVQDATYPYAGLLWFGAGTFANTGLTVEARFDNLVVTAR